jgi:hypothetical protein
VSKSIPYSDSQTLITGVYRTGSEYVAQLINSHPEISVTMYRVNVIRFIYDRYNPIADKKNYTSALNELEERLRVRYDVSINKELILDSFSRVRNLDYGKFYDIVMNALYLSKTVYHWAEKNQLLWRAIPLFIDIMPNGKTILIIRDPRSVLLSFKKYTYAEPPAYLGAVFNCLDSMQYALIYKDQFPSNKFFVVRYEDAANKPVKTARRIWRFLGLSEKFDITVEEMAGWTDAYGKTWQVNSSFHSDDNPLPFDVKAAIDRWKKWLSEVEISLVEGVCGDIMEKFGYERSLKSPDWLSAMRLFVSDDKIMSYFKHWLLTGEGIEAFPTDPLKPENWRV